MEVDFILGDMQAAIEVKAAARVHDGELRPLQVLRQEQRVGKSIMVCAEPVPRNVDGVSIMPWTLFLEQLWAGGIVD